MTAASYLARQGRQAGASSEMTPVDVDALHRYIEDHVAVPAQEIQRLRELGLLSRDGDPTALGRAVLGRGQERP